MPWPHTLSKSRANLASAALRHVGDAATLAKSSPVQAFHLAGFGPECARKAALTWHESKSEAEIDKAVGHGFRADSEVALEWVLAVDPLVARYELPDWKARFPPLKEWNEQVRYAPSDQIGAVAAKKMVDAATDAVTQVLTALWADGRLPSLDLLERVKP